MGASALAEITMPRGLRSSHSVEVYFYKNSSNKNVLFRIEENILLAYFVPPIYLA